MKREKYLNRLRRLAGVPVVKVLAGMRRSGKTVLMRQFAEEMRASGKSTLEYNFEILNPGSAWDASALYNDIKDSSGGDDGKTCLFLDEVQEIDGWERVVNSLLAEGNHDIYITGSNSRMLSGELSTYLAGRFAEIEVFPFTYSEYLGLTGKDPGTGFMDFFLEGGMPSALRVSGDPVAARDMLGGIHSSVVLRDVVSRNGVRDADTLERLVSFLMSNSGRAFSANSVAKYLRAGGKGVSVDTVLNYVRYCEEAYLVKGVRKADVHGKGIMGQSEKHYFCDHGIREAMVGGNAENRGHVLEGIILVELLSRGYDVKTGDVMGREIDFVCDRGSDRMYVQVAWTAGDPETAEREFRPFRDIRDGYPRFLVTTDGADLGQEGVTHMNVADFLLNQNLY
ncbi:MAG: ATP-binding protein [Thermoplasmatales archaeon]|nr:ATP-binding protein [Thermoplasmatales archaeon]